MAILNNKNEVIMHVASWYDNSNGTMLCIEGIDGDDGKVKEYELLESITRAQLYMLIAEDMERNGSSHVWRCDDGPGVIWCTVAATNEIISCYCNDSGDGDTTLEWLYRHLHNEFDINALDEESEKYMQEQYDKLAELDAGS